MSPRALVVVATLAAVAIALAVIGQRRTAPASRPESPLVLPGLAEALEDLTQVTVVAAGGETVATIERGAAGWTIAERDGYRADVARLRDALVALSEARIVERKTAEPALHAKIGVEDVELETATGVLVRAAAGNGAERALILGHSDRAGERYARRPGEAQSVLIDRDAELPRTTAGWLDPEILDVEPARVRSVAVRHDDGAALELSKSDPSEPNFAVAGVPEGRELTSAGAANATGRALRALRLEDVARLPADTARVPVATITYSTFDGLEIRVTAYSIDDEHWLVFDAAAAGTASDEVAAEAEDLNARLGGWRYRIASYRYEQMARRLDDLLAPVEQP